MRGFYMSNNKQIQIDRFFKKFLKQAQSANNIKDIDLVTFKNIVNHEDPQKIIHSIKKIGFFRPSKYDFDIQIISILLNTIKTSSNFKNFNSYFLQMKNLFNLSKGAKESLKKIREYLLSNNNLVKFLFAKADDLFYKNAGTSNPEITLECISFLILECRKKQYTHGINLSRVTIISEIEFNKLINLSKDIIIFKKMEIKLDFFEYELKKEKKQTYFLSNPSFEKNISFSYLSYDQQRYIIQKSTLDNSNNEKTFSELMMDFLRSSDKQFISEIKKEPFTRVCAKFTLAPPIIQLFTTDHIYLDERYILNSFFLDNFLESTDINSFFYKDFTLLDIIKIQRFYTYLSILYRQVISKSLNLKKNNDKVLISSIIPITTKSYLNQILNKIYKTTNKNFYELIYDLMSVSFYTLDDFFDIQYTPAISFGNELVISPSIISKSNLIRSCLLKLNINFSINQKTDKMIISIEKNLIQAGFSVSTEVQIGNFEIDIIAKKGNEVFIFECKNSYHPVNEFELRNVFSHIQKASIQLENIKTKISDISTRKNLSKKINFSLYKCNFHFAIINSNRLFNGYLHNNYRCINSYILNNLLCEGLIRVNNDLYSLWKNENFNEFDLVSLINGTFISDYENFAHEDTLTYKFQNYTLKLQRFGYSLEEISEHIKMNYKEILKL